MDLFYLNNMVLPVLNFNLSSKLSLTLIVSLSFGLEGGEERLSVLNFKKGGD